jgi:predicted PurR-regulated permease PerM
MRTTPIASTKLGAAAMSEISLSTPSPTRAQIPSAETPKPEALLRLATAVVIVAALFLAREVLIPITLAIFLSFFLAPIVRFMQRMRLPKVAAVILAVALAFVVIFMVGTLIGSQITTLAENAPRYRTTVLQKYEGLRGAVTGLTNNFTSRVVTPSERPSANPPSLTEPKPDQQPVPVAVAPSSASTLENGWQIAQPILSPLATLAIVLIVAIFILAQQEDLRDRLIRLFGSSDLHRTTQAINDGVSRLSRYFLTQAAINASFGALIAAGLYFIGLPSPILWGVLAALLRFVPYIGSLVSAGLPLLLAAAVDPGWSMVFWTGGLFIICEGLTGQVLEPLLYGRSTGLSPTAVVIVAIFWSWIWGPIGLILSTPLTLCLVVLGRHVRHLEFFDVLLGDRPALTPIEAFYQRLLAGDPDEILEQAETLLKGRALSSYYDDIAIKALQLATDDIGRGVVSGPQVEKIREEMITLVQDLEPHDDVNPELTVAQAAAANVEVAGYARPERETPSQLAPEGQAPDHDNRPSIWSTERSILCIAGRGPLDEVASSMLAQLLRKHGLGAQMLPHQAASRASIASLDTSGTAMLCIAYLQIIGSPPHLRYLLRRLRQRFPNSPILIGMWSADDAFLRDSEAQAMTGGNLFVGSLHDAVKSCLTEAYKALPEN